MQEAVAAAGTIDVLVNNAGVGTSGPIELVPMAEVRRVFETNTFGPFRMMQAVLPQMRARGAGTIVNVSSVSGRVSAPLSGIYAGSKFALEAMSEALHVEGGHFGIRTIVIEPGFFKTNISESPHDFGVDAPPYDELAESMEKLTNELGRAEAPGPEVVATAIADALESPGSAWRVPVGADAEMVLAAARRWTTPPSRRPSARCSSSTGDHHDALPGLEVHGLPHHRALGGAVGGQCHGLGGGPSHADLAPRGGN